MLERGEGGECAERGMTERREADQNVIKTPLQLRTAAVPPCHTRFTLFFILKPNRCFEGAVTLLKKSFAFSVRWNFGRFCWSKQCKLISAFPSNQHLVCCC